MHQLHLIIALWHRNFHWKIDKILTLPGESLLSFGREIMAAGGVKKKWLDKLENV
ncbi:MAG: hypothetical protein ACOX7T_03535 [Pseudoflavonifractor sp.]|jgi:hypothetical protein